MKYGSLRLCLAMAVIAPMVACAGAHARAHRESNAEVILVSFGATKGELKDCGCHSTPKGGLSRRASFIDSLRVRHETLLVVDLGDFMNDEEAVADLKNRFLVRKMEEMGYRLTTPGAREISDWRRYRDLLEGSPIRTVATNLTVIEGGKESRAGLAYRIEEVNGVRVAFFSLIGTEELAGASPPPGLQFRAEDPLAAATRIVPQLHKKADLVVLVSQMSAGETDELLSKVGGIDVALYGREPRWFDAARMSSTTIVQQTGSRGVQLGELILIVDPSGKIIEWGSRNDALTPEYGENLEVAAQVEQIESEAKLRITADQQRKATEIDRAVSGEKPVEKQP
jgi:2',3'-cyclic-nucleotide 2'-phosphodiesterase (5'-nucleotidase family)